MCTCSKCSGTYVCGASPLPPARCVNMDRPRDCLARSKLMCNIWLKGTTSSLRGQIFPTRIPSTATCVGAMGPLSSKRPTVPHKRALKPILVPVIFCARPRLAGGAAVTASATMLARRGLENGPVSQKHHVQSTAASKRGLFTLTEIASQTSKPPSEWRHRESQTVYRWASSTCLNQ